MSEFLSPAWVHEFIAICRDDAELRAASKATAFRMLLRADRQGCVLVFDGGLRELYAEQPVNDTWDFALESSQATWTEFLKASPPRHHHDVLAMWMRVNDFHIEGDRRLFMASVQVVRRLTELARELESGPVVRRQPADGPADGIEPIEGRYVWLEMQGRRYRVYFEQAGSGQPLLLLHTAGADSRQYMHMLNDPDFTRHWRLVAFDMPRHGRSMPPDRWWQEEYHLTTEFYAEITAAFVRAIGLSHPIAIGCSMGGEIVLELAYRFPDLFAAVIGFEAAEKVPGRRIVWTHHPEVNAMSAVPGWVDGLVGPRSPERHRREIWWTYSQSGIGVFNGDIDFFSNEWDGRLRMNSIDTQRCPVVLLTGEDDYSCTAEMSAATAARIPGARFATMPGLGHFPIAEDPMLFKQYLLPELRALSSLT